MNYDEELKRLRANLEKANKLKNVAEGKLDQLKSQETEILNELNKLGIKPENLGIEIDNLQREIESNLKEAERLMPVELLDRLK